MDHYFEKWIRILGVCAVVIIILAAAICVRDTAKEEIADEKVRIAFIDSPCSRQIEIIFSEILWENKDEIPDNEIDDDKNGYIDDVCGWNFVANERKIFTEKNLGHCDFVLMAFLETMMKASDDVQYEIILISVLDTDGECQVTDLIKAIKYADENGANICNLSLSTYYDSEELKEAIEESEMLFVAAAGNDGEDLDEGFPSYPANYKLNNVISVAATDENGILLEDSNFGRRSVDAAINGILKYEDSTVEGTSIAAGRMSGIITISYDNIQKPYLKNYINKYTISKYTH